MRHGGFAIRADYVIDGNTLVNKDMLTAGSIAVKSGAVTLGDSETGSFGGLRATSKGIQFYSGSSLCPVGEFNSLALCGADATVIFHPRSVLDIRDGSLVLTRGRLLLHGELVLGCRKNDPILLNYVGVKDKGGKVVLGDAFSVRISESLQETYLDNPEDAVNDAIVIDATITRFTYEPGEVWEQSVSTPSFLFTLTARLGVPPDDGGGLRLSWKKVETW